MSRSFNVAPYFDDYNEAKEFIKILFRPGLAVQTRELTQSQTILQKQVERVGGYLFEEGSEVVNSQTSFDLEYNYVKLSGEINGASVSRILQLFASGEVQAEANGIVADVVNILDSEGTDPITLYVKYRKSGSNNQAVFSDGATINLFYETQASPRTQFASCVAASTAATGYGSSANISAGTRFINGYFLQNDAQSIILDKYNNKPTVDIGLRVIEEIVTPETDQSLLDNAQGYPNQSAPGAHRYRIRLKLDVKGDDSQNFIRILTLKEGVIQEDRRQANLRRTGIEKELAKRTYDTNGNFIVEPFKVEVREHLKVGNNRGYFDAPIGDESKLVLDVDAGRAYISGYEVATTGAEFIEIDKARDTATYNNAVVGASYGAYMKVDNPVFPNGIANFQSRFRITFNNGATARVRNIEYSSGELKMYLFAVTGDISTAVSFTGENGCSGDVVLDTDDVLFGLSTVGDSVTAEVLPFNVAKAVLDVSYDVRRVGTGVVSGNEISFSAEGGTSFSTDTSAKNYGAYDRTNGVFLDSNMFAADVNGGTCTFTFDPLLEGNTIDYYYTINKNDASNALKRKTLVTDTANVTVTAGIGILSHIDIVKINSIFEGAVDRTDEFTLDDGQRDGHYGLGRIVLKSGFSAPASPVTVSYDHYNHSSGDYFTAESYPDYETIPTYTSSFGDVFVLRDTIDFRPALPNQDALQAGDIFVPKSTIRGDIPFYLGRIDKVVVDETGRFFVKRGAAALNPVAPPTPDIGMTIFEVAVPPYTFDPSDVRLEYIENKRFTMRDIGKLESRIENLEYYTSLNLLEQSVANTTFSDNLGEKFKNGFLVDAFSGHGIGDTANPDYLCAIDQAEGECRPPSNAEFVGLDLTGSVGVKQSGSLITLDYSEVVLASQQLASRTENVNPYAVFSWDGTLKLSPSSDTWIDIDQKPNIVVNREETFSNVVNIRKPKGVWQSLYAWWTNVWFGQQQAIFGVARERASSATSTSTSVAADGTVNRTTTNVITTKTKRPFRTKIVQRITRQTVSDRIVDLSIVPFIREKELQWEVSRMKPNTVLYPFFDGVDVSAYVTAIDSNNVVTSTILTDDAGYAKGTFNIPNSDVARFRTGKRIFRLIDNPANDEGLALTLADTVYTASGVLQTRQSTITSTKETVTTKNKLKINWIDPLAQSFLVEQRGGVFLTSIDVYFKTYDPAIPVTLQVREMVNGYPSQNIVPMSEVSKLLESSDVSEDGSVATRFEFESPIYLQDGNEYCFVILANSQRYNMFVSQMGEADTITGELIVKQPFAGVLFKSQNASTWTADQTQDLKFVINRASFVTNVNAELVFNNQDLVAEYLDVNPFYFDGNVDNKWKVKADTHGMTEGSLVEIIIGTTSGIWNVDSVIDNDTILVSWSNTKNGGASQPTLSVTNAWTGGEDNQIVKNYAMDSIHAVFQNMDAIGQDEETGEPLTRIDWFIKSIETKSVNGTSKQNPYEVDSDFVAFEVNDTFLFDEPKMVASKLNEDEFLSGDKSLTIQAQLYSNVENVSPVIDLERIGAIAVANKTSYPDLVELEAEELLPSVGDTEKASSFRYITKKVAINNPATELRVIFDGNRFDDADFQVYVKYLASNNDSPFEFESWVKMDSLGSVASNKNYDEFSEYSFTIDSLDPFQLFAVKIIGVSKDSTMPPRIKNFRAIAISS